MSVYDRAEFDIRLRLLRPSCQLALFWLAQGMDDFRIGYCMNIKNVTAKSHIYRARQTLKFKGTRIQLAFAVLGAL